MHCRATKHFHGAMRNASVVPLLYAATAAMAVGQPNLEQIHGAAKYSQCPESVALCANDDASVPTNFVKRMRAEWENKFLQSQGPTETTIEQSASTPDQTEEQNPSDALNPAHQTEEQNPSVDPNDEESQSESFNVWNGSSLPKGRSLTTALLQTWMGDINNRQGKAKLDLLSPKERSRLVRRDAASRPLNPTQRQQLERWFGKDLKDVDSDLGSAGNSKHVRFNLDQTTVLDQDTQSKLSEPPPQRANFITPDMVQLCNQEGVSHFLIECSSSHITPSAPSRLLSPVVLDALLADVTPLLGSALTGVDVALHFLKKLGAKEERARDSAPSAQKAAPTGESAAFASASAPSAASETVSKAAARPVPLIFVDVPCNDLATDDPTTVNRYAVTALLCDRLGELSRRINSPAVFAPDLRNSESLRDFRAWIAATLDRVLKAWGPPGASTDRGMLATAGLRSCAQAFAAALALESAQADYISDFGSATGARRILNLLWLNILTVERLWPLAQFLPTFIVNKRRLYRSSAIADAVMELTASAASDGTVVLFKRAAPYYKARLVAFADAALKTPLRWGALLKQPPTDFWVAPRPGPGAAAVPTSAVRLTSRGELYGVSANAPDARPQLLALKYTFSNVQKCLEVFLGSDR